MQNKCQCSTNGAALNYILVEFDTFIVQADVHTNETVYTITVSNSTYIWYILFLSRNCEKNNQHNINHLHRPDKVSFLPTFMKAYLWCIRPFNGKSVTWTIGICSVTAEIGRTVFVCNKKGKPNYKQICWNITARGVTQLSL